MIERESSIFIANDAMGEILKTKNTKGRLVRIAPEGFYEVRLTVNGKNHSAFLPISTTVLVAATPEDDVVSIPVER